MAGRRRHSRAGERAAQRPPGLAARTPRGTDRDGRAARSHRAHRHRRGTGHVRWGAGARRRAVLHDQAAGARNRARTVRGAVERGTIGRDADAGIASRRGHDGDAHAARRRINAASLNARPAGPVMSDAPLLLIVEDDTLLRERLARAFASRGYDVRQADDIAGAEAAAVAEPPELVVLDLRMPQGNGIDLIPKLLAIDPATRIVVLTGYGSV